MFIYFLFEFEILRVSVLKVMFSAYFRNHKARATKMTVVFYSNFIIEKYENIPLYILFRRTILHHVYSSYFEFFLKLFSTKKKRNKSFEHPTPFWVMLLFEYRKAGKLFKFYYLLLNKVMVFGIL